MDASKLSPKNQVGRAHLFHPRRKKRPANVAGPSEQCGLSNPEIQRLGSCVGVNFCPSANGRVDAKSAAASIVMVSVPKPRNRVGNDFVVVPFVRQLISTGRGTVREAF
jgi:hypothetical protein